MGSRSGCMGSPAAAGRSPAHRIDGAGPARYHGPHRRSARPARRRPPGSPSRDPRHPLHDGDQRRGSCPRTAADGDEGGAPPSRWFGDPSPRRRRGMEGWGVAPPARGARHHAHPGRLPHRRRGGRGPSEARHRQSKGFSDARALRRALADVGNAYAGAEICRAASVRSSMTSRCSSGSTRPRSHLPRRQPALPGCAAARGDRSSVHAPASA
jgi:hypothetical protein